MWTIKHRRDDGSFVIELANGWPYHVVNGDDLFAAVSAAAEGQVFPPEPPPEPPPPAPLPPVSGRQFKAALAIMGVITEAEMVSPELPAMAQPVLADMTAHQRIIARATWPNLREVRGDEAQLAAFAAAHDPPLGAAEIEQIMMIARSIP